MYADGPAFERQERADSTLKRKRMKYKHVQGKSLHVSQLSWMSTLYTADVVSHAPASYHANGILALTFLSSGCISSITSSSASSYPVHSYTSSSSRTSLP